MERSAVQLDLESGTIYRRTSHSQTCHTAVSESRKDVLYGQWEKSVQCSVSAPLTALWKSSYLLNNLPNNLLT